MALFSRRRSSAASSQARAIDDFWSWWQAVGARDTAEAIAADDPARSAEALSRHVRAVDKGLGWELGPGTAGSEHVLMVTPEGNPALRAVARRWRLAAPPSDPVWEYSDARRRMTDMDAATLVLDGVEIDLASGQVAARVSGATVDVTVHHPAFGRLREPRRMMAAILLLDWAVGEADVEAWVGTVTTTTVTPLDPVPVSGLRAVVRHLVDQNTDDEGNPRWVLLQGEGRNGAAVVAGAQVPLKAVTAPQLDTHVAVIVPYTEQTAAGLPGPAAFTAVRELEGHLADRLGGSGRLVAHETSAGRRVLHFYVDGTTPAADQLRAATSGWQDGRVRVDEVRDPAWKRVQHLRP
ncbi:MAG: DUF695 domain-containing protein [Kineosporiaceae bacterium]